MSSQSREKIALAVFAALIVLSLCGFGWYLIAGHSWNVAATNIDDTFGSMDGYTAIVYTGTAEPEVAPDKEAATDTLGKELSTALPASGAATAASTENGGTPPATTGSDVATSTASTEKVPVAVEDARVSYEDKKAVVFVLDTVEPERYSEGTILKKGNHRFGVFSVDKPLSKRAIEKQVAYFTEHKVDFIVAVVQDKVYVDEAVGIDIVVSTQEEGLFVMGETVGGTFYVDAPEIGKVGAIVISPSNVVSAKVIEEL